MTSPETANPVSKFSIFVVEDEALVALNLEDMLLELGCTIEASAMRVEQALEMVQRGVAADIAILDVNLGGKPVFPVAELLVEAGMRIIFATGYGRSGLPEEWRDRPVLQKPYTMEEVAACLQSATKPPVSPVPEARA